MAYPSAFDIELANDALTRLSEGPIGSFNDNTPQARAVSRLYPRVRGLMFSSDMDWRFATARADLGVGQAGVYPWTYEYLLPANVGKVRMILATAPGLDGRALGPREWEEGINSTGTQRVVRCDVAPATLVYTMEVIDSTLWDSGFAASFTLQLAAELALPVTGNGGLAREMMQMAQQSIAAQSGARQVQSVTQQPPGSSRTTMARGGG